MGYNFPNAPTVGQLYPAVAVSGQPQWQWDGVTWLLKSMVGAPTIYVGDNAPTPAIDNSLWWESDTGVLWLRYRDADSAQWINATPAPQAGPQGPAGKWTQLTQAQYNALSPPDPNTLYVIVG